MLFVVRYEHGPGWDPARLLREQDLWHDHAAFMDELTETGFVILGGPLGTDAGALLVVEASGAAAIAARLAADPWLPSGLLRIAMIEPWTILLGDGTALSQSSPVARRSS